MAIPVWGGVSFTSTGRLIREIVNYYPGAKGHLYITSSYRPNSSGSHHSGLSYNGSPTAAVDIGFGYPSGNYNGGKGLASWLRANFQSYLVELIHTPGSYFVKYGRRVGPYAASAHKDHVHVAMSRSQANTVLARLRKSGAPSGGGSGDSSGGLPNPITSIRSIKSQQEEVNRTSISPKLKEDGKWGPNTYNGVKFAQRRYGVDDDGKWGPATEAGHDKYHSKSSSGGGGSEGDLDVDGVVGSKTITRLQEFLNSKV